MAQHPDGMNTAATLAARAAVSIAASQRQVNNQVYNPQLNARLSGNYPGSQQDAGFPTTNPHHPGKPGMYPGPT